MKFRCKMGWKGEPMDYDSLTGISLKQIAGPKINI
jgi:hypothetical protein